MHQDSKHMTHIFSVEVDLENYRDPDLSITCWSLICCFVFGLASLIFYQRARTAKTKNQLEVYLVENSRSHLLALVGIVIGNGLIKISVTII